MQQNRRPTAGALFFPNPHDGTYRAYPPYSEPREPPSPSPTCQHELRIEQLEKQMDQLTKIKPVKTKIAPEKSNK